MKTLINNMTAEFGTIQWAINSAAKTYSKVKENAFVDRFMYNRKNLIAFVNKMQKPYIVASTKDMFELGLIPEKTSFSRFDTKKTIWSINYVNNKLSLMPLR